MKRKDNSEPTITRLWLVRHGEPLATIRGRCYGRLDAALSEVGQAQMQLVAQALRNEPLAAIYACPRIRTRESAGIISRNHGLRVEVHDELREIDFGEFEGRAYEEIEQLYPEIYWRWMEHPTEAQFPGGEGFTVMQERVLKATRELTARHAGQSLAIVAHGGVTRIILADALGTPGAHMFRLGQGYAARSLIRYIGDYPAVELVNQVPEIPYGQR